MVQKANRISYSDYVCTYAQLYGFSLEDFSMGSPSGRPAQTLISLPSSGGENHKSFLILSFHVMEVIKPALWYYGEDLMRKVYRKCLAHANNSITKLFLLCHFYSLYCRG